MRSGDTDGRPFPSKVMLDLRRERRKTEERLDAAGRLEAAFSLSLELRRLFRAGLLAQGFSEAEIEALWARRR